MFELAASVLTSRAYVKMLLKLLGRPTWTALDFIVLSCYKTIYSYTAQLLYITSNPLFGQHYEIEALVSEFEVSPTVWNVLAPEYRDQENKSTA